MFKGGLLPSPVIIPLSSNNKIHTQTFIELRSDVPNGRIYFTVDGSKPDPLRTGSISPNLYRGAFRLGAGRRVVKAMAMTNDGLRESQVTTKYFDVHDDDSDNDQSVINHSPRDFDQSVWDNAFNNERPPPREYWINPIKEQISEVKLPPPPPPVPQIIEVIREDENFWDRKSKPLSSGNGNWRKTLEHLFSNIYHFVKDEPELRELFGWKLFGRIETTRLIDKGGTYQILTTFKKPLGEKTSYEEPPMPIRKPHPKRRSKKRTRTPTDIEYEKPIRRTAPVPKDEEEGEEENEEKRSTRIYTEEREEEGTLGPFPNFNADRDCDSLRKAIKGAGANENIVIDILGNRSSDQRVKIRDQYKTMFSRDFDTDLAKDTSGDFRPIVKLLLFSPVEYDCYELQRAIKGLGTDEEILIEILTTRSNKRLQAINNLYPKLFDQTLEQDILSDTSAHLKRISMALVHTHRPESNEIHEGEVEKDAKGLHAAGEKKWGTDESKFIQILCKRSDVQLKAVFEAYRHYSKRDIEADIKSETSGSLRKCLLAIVRLMRNRPGYFAYRLKNALKGADTDERELNHVVISRCEVDMVQIKREYANIIKSSLEEQIESNTNGEYQHMLLELIKDPTDRIRKPEKETTPRSRKSPSNVDPPDYEQPEIYKEEIIQQGTMVAASNFDANRDADALRKAMKGVGTDEKTLINILGNRTTSQRLEIKAAFTNKHKRDLLSDLKSETSSNFSKLLERLMMNAIELDCFELKQAVKGAGTDEEGLIEILASRSNERIRKINDTYQKMYSKPLEKDVKSDTSGDFRRLLIALMQGQRPETADVNVEQVKKDAQSLVDAGTARFRTDQSKFNTLFCERSDAQLKAILNKFAELSGKSIEDTAKKETTGDHQRGIFAILRCIQSRPDFFAEQLRKAIKGVGTKESVLNRIIITRSEIDLVQIKIAYKHLYNRDLERDISSDTSGYYEKLLLEILKDPSQRH